LFNTGEVVIGILDSNQFPLPRAKAEQRDREESSAFEPAD
jgi:hypothetical protein